MGWKRLTSCCTAILILSAPALHAHPLGETSVNQYLVLRVEGDGLHIGYRIDFAETPAAQELRQLDADGDGTVSEAEQKKYLASRQDEWVSRVTMMVNDKECGLKVTEASLKLSDGAGGRKTLLVMLDVVADKKAWTAGRNRAQVTVGNYSHVAGWREAAVLCGEGFWVVDNEQRGKAKVLDTRAETAEEGRDWMVGFAFEAKGTTTSRPAR